ncbi:MAG: STAS domain-containing protein [Ferruginibacter sp.]|nr:STAS domain-containing protein [Bacteroidota bacterium]MBX2919277.1 STAS domain-containing protein [Ferruginibacter sp.]MCB0709731.1 STAS domain-containing protein [Chitinophagaceae bacterium]MCC7378465.1 STAS domain-containing protein [Chitinophagaceae bacterium]
MLNVKIDTKEKFTVITPQDAHLPAIMTDELTQMLLGCLQKDIPHVIVNMQAVQSVDIPVAKAIAKTQQQFYENNCSFVVCNLTKEVEAVFNNADILDTMNVTPSESEAWDIVQMEEIERELLGD